MPLRWMGMLMCCFLRHHDIKILHINMSPRDGSVQPQSHRRTSAMLPHYNSTITSTDPSWAEHMMISWTWDFRSCGFVESATSEYKIFYYKKYKIQNDKLYYTDTDNNSSQNQDYISFITLMPIQECCVTLYNITVLQVVIWKVLCIISSYSQWNLLSYQLFIYFFEYLSAGPSYLSVRI